jgi:signal transduction histidine kinase
MLQNLGQYTRYLEKLPDTLAHEMNNPLNVVNSSLDYLEYQHRDLVDDKYLNRARSGIFRLRTILTSLTEAANLKEALRNEQSDEERFNLVELVTGCVDGYQLSNPSRAFLNHFPASPVFIHGTPDRIAQLLDKLIDNAVQFGRERSAIIVRINELPNIIQLSVINDGPTLPSELSARVFDPMVSSSTDARHSHLGLGLYIVREIAEFHGATVVANNRGDANGVEVTVNFTK